MGVIESRPCGHASLNLDRTPLANATQGAQARATAPPRAAPRDATTRSSRRCLLGPSRRVRGRRPCGATANQRRHGRHCGTTHGRRSGATSRWPHGCVRPRAFRHHRHARTATDGPSLACLRQLCQRVHSRELHRCHFAPFPPRAPIVIRISTHATSIPAPRRSASHTGRLQMRDDASCGFGWRIPACLPARGQTSAHAGARTRVETWRSPSGRSLRRRVHPET